jgi:hypothetical protein
MIDKLSINNEMAMLDTKSREFFDSLSPEEQKKFNPFLMIRWAASVQGSPELQAYYLMSVNERLNKHFFDISTTDHKKFQWLLATTISPNMGRQKYQWLGAKKKDNTNSKTEKMLRSLYPHMKDDEIELLGRINTKNDIKQLAREHGWDDKRIKTDL